MKKGFMVSVAICSLLVMAACGNDTKEAAEAPAEQAATQTTTQPAEQKTETAAAAEVETVAEPETSEVSTKSTSISNADQRLIEEYAEELEPTMNLASPLMHHFATAAAQWNNGEIDDATMREYLLSANAAFAMLEYDFTRIQVPEVESEALYNAVSEFHAVMLGLGVDGGKAIDLFIKAIDAQDSGQLEEAYDILAVLEQYSERGEAALVELSTMIDME